MPNRSHWPSADELVRRNSPVLIQIQRQEQAEYMVTQQEVKKWKNPGFQRPVRENEKVKHLSEELKKNGGVWPGVVTLGVYDGDTFIIDGQHRRAAFLISGLMNGYLDVRIHHFQSESEMGEEFVKLNSQLARMGPDDILRGLEGSLPTLQLIRERCDFIGYDMVRRNEKAPLVSMSATIRSWRGSQPEFPTMTCGSAQTVAMNMDIDSAKELCDFMLTAMSAWGRDPSYYRLWGTLNMILTMWMYRRLVLKQHGGFKKATPMSIQLFGKCLMSLSADLPYLDWLTGRMLRESDRGPAFVRIKTIFAKRAALETGSKVLLPQPEWSSR